MKKVLFYLGSLVIIAILATIAYQYAINFTYTRHITLPPQLLASSTTDATSSITALAPDAFGITDSSFLDPASTTADMTNWHMYTDARYGFSLQYPGDMTMTASSSGEIDFIPSKDSYFHWPLLDDTKISITVASSCPALMTPGPDDAQPVSSTLNGYAVIRSEGSDVAAGNLYRELAYDLSINGSCYHVDLLDHGANGAGLYVSDQSLISQYNAQHQTDLMALLSSFTAMVNSFRIMVY